MTPILHKLEAEKLQVLRLDDHVKKLIDLARYNENEASICIFRLLNNLDISRYQLMCIQLTFLYRKTIDFCHKNELMEKTFLFPLSETCQEIVDIRSYYKDSVKHVMSVNQYIDIDEQLNEGTYKNQKEGSFTKDSASSSRAFLSYALDFCDFLFEDAHSEQNNSLFNYLDFLIHTLEDDIIYQLNKICKATNSKNFEILRDELIKDKESIVALVNFAKEKKLNESKSQHKVTATISPYNLFYIKSRERRNISQNEEKYSKDEVKYLPQQRSNIS